MPLWKILTIGLFAFASIGLVMATIVVPLSLRGAERWGWLGGLVVTTACVGALFAMFLRYAERNMDVKTRGMRY